MTNEFVTGDLFCREVKLGGSLHTTQIVSAVSPESHATQSEKFKMSVGVAVRRFTTGSVTLLPRSPSFSPFPNRVLFMYG